MSVDKSSTPELLNLYAEILNELNSRKIIRTYNSPVGDYAEWLVAEKLGLILEPNSKKGYDALDQKTGVRYQIKSRWERGTISVQSRELSVIRNYDGNQFDMLIAVIFDDNFNVKEAYAIPHELVKEYGRYNKHVNGYIVIATGNLLSDPRTKNVTDSLR